MIIITLTFNHKSLRLSTGLSVPVKAWDKEEQRAKPLKDYAETNKKLRDITSFLLDKYDDLFHSESTYTKDKV